MKSAKPIVFLFLGLFILLSSCDIIYKAENKGKKKVWAFIELEKITLADTSNYFYYGQITEALVAKLETGKRYPGMFLLENIRYLNDDDLLQLYEDEDDSGNILFKISDIQEITLMKKDPIFTYDHEELHESAVKLKERYMKATLPED